MAAEDAVVDMLFTIATRIMVSGAELGLKITGTGAKAIAVSFYALGKSIFEKEKSGKKLTAGENAYKDLMKCGEEIHSVWISKDDLKNFAQIAKQLGVSFVAIKNGDELDKSHKFLSHKDKDGNAIEFVEAYKDMVSISYRASDEIRMAHILEMFNNFNKSETTVDDKVTEKETVKDDVEEFMKENGVKVERPPEVVEAEEVNKEKSQVSEKDLPTSNEEIKDRHYGSETQLCFEHFGFDKPPTQAEYDNAYIKYITDNGINPAEPNYTTALYEQGSKIIANQITKQEITVDRGKPEPIIFDKSNLKPRVAENVPECFAFFGFKEIPPVQELKKAYIEYVAKNGKTAGSNIVDNMYEAAADLINKPNEENLKFCYEFFGFDHKPTKSELDAAYKAYDANSTSASTLAKGVYENALKYMERSNSVRETLQAKQELNKIKENAADKVVDKAKNITKNILEK